MDDALKFAYLAFDATFMSATDVSFPIDVVLYRLNTYDIVEHRFEKEDFIAVSAWWQEHIVKSIAELQVPQFDAVFHRAKEQPSTHNACYAKAQGQSEEQEQSSQMTVMN